MKAKNLEVDLFEPALTAAEKRNPFAMRKLIAQGFSLSKSKGEYTLVLLLSEKGNWQAVDFLINKFNGSLNEAIRGAGLRGESNRVMELYQKGASLKFGLFGLAEGKYLADMELLLKFNKDALVALRCYILSDLITSADLIIEAESDPDEKQLLINQAALAYACKKNVKEAKRMHEKGAPASFLVYGYIRGNHTKELQDLVINHPSFAFINGYGFQGDYEKVLQELQPGNGFYPYFEQALFSFANGGHRELELKLRQAFSGVVSCSEKTLLKLIKIYAENGNISAVNAMLNEHGGGPLYANPFRREAVEGYVRKDYLNSRNFLRLLSLTRDALLRENLAEYIVTHFGRSYHIEKLIKKSLCIRNVMFDYQLGFDEAKNLSPGIETFILQGIHTINPNNQTKALPEEIFWRILKWLLDVDDFENAVDIYLAVHNHLRNKMLQALPKPTFFTSKKDIKENELRKNHIIARYEERISQTGYGKRQNEQQKKQIEECDTIISLGRF